MKEITVIDNEQQDFPIELSHLFARLAPQDVEQFYQSYRLWSLQRDIAILQAQASELQHKIEHNARLMQSIQPSPIALSALAQLQAYGVSDTDLLDRMLERGDSWLDHTVQLLVRCEELGVIRSDYTQWCENALEGAYDWITSMDQATATPEENAPFDQNVEVAFLQKLMSEDDDTEPRLPIVKADSISIADQDTLVPINNAEYESPEAPTQSVIDTVEQHEIAAEMPVQEDNSDQSTAISQPSAETDYAHEQSDLDSHLPTETASSCPPYLSESQEEAHEHDQSTPTESGMLAASGRSYGTTEAINLEDLKVSINTQDAVSDASVSSVVSGQLTDAIKQVEAASDAQNFSTEISEDATTIQENDLIYHIYDPSDDISYNKDIFVDSFIIVDSLPPETTNSMHNATEQTAYQEDNSEAQTAVITTFTTTNTVTARTVKNFARPAGQAEPTAEHTTPKVYLQEDDLALPPVTDTHKASSPWHNEPTEFTDLEPQLRQTQQTTTVTYHEPAIAWSDSTELPQVSPEKRPGLLTRLFRHPRNSRND